MKIFVCEGMLAGIPSLKCDYYVMLNNCYVGLYCEDGNLYISEEWLDYALIRWESYYNRDTVKIIKNRRHEKRCLKTKS